MPRSRPKMGMNAVAAPAGAKSGLTPRARAILARTERALGKRRPQPTQPQGKP